MYYYCTLFDSNYLHKGLALYQSLKKCCPNFHLYIAAFDEQCYKKLIALNLSFVTVIALQDFETEELLCVKPTRTNAEYYWTCGPSIILYCINRFQLEHCTYLDADMMFYSSPEPIYKEIGDSSIALTEHFIENDLGGKYCVQFVFFKNDSYGIEALSWWKNECIKWCFSRFEEGKYGDQKYLDEIPNKFEHVCVLKNRGVGIAPWNMSLYFFERENQIRYNSAFFNIVFFHFHGTRVAITQSTLTLETVTYDIDESVEANIYMPYLLLLKEVSNLYLKNNITYITIKKRNWKQRAYSNMKKKIRKYSIAQFIYYNIFRVRYNGYEKKSLLG